MKEFLRKNKLQLIIILFLVIVFSFFYFLVRPNVRGIAEKANEIQQKKIDSEINEKRLADVYAMEDNYKQVKENEINLDTDIAAEKEVDFIKELEILAEQTGNRIEFQIKEEAKQPAAKSKGEVGIKDTLANKNYLSMQIALEGSYMGMVNFVHKLENYKNYVNILSISSEKRNLEDAGSTSPFQSSKIKKPEKEILNSILDVAVYMYTKK